VTDDATVDGDSVLVLVATGDMTPVEVDDALFLYDAKTRRFFRLNASARAVYERCDGIRTLSAIADELAALYPDDAAGVRRDVTDTATDLLELGLVGPASPGQSAAALASLSTRLGGTTS
jgi:hypothetical protein